MPSRDERMARLEACLHTPIITQLWERVLVDGTTLSPQWSLFVGVVAMYTDKEVHFGHNTKSNITWQQMIQVILDCVPSVKTLYRMVRQRGELVRAGHDSFASDDEDKRDEAVFALAEQVLKVDDLPIAFAVVSVTVSDEFKVAFHGLRQVPLADTWRLYRKAIERAFSP